MLEPESRALSTPAESDVVPAVDRTRPPDAGPLSPVPGGWQLQRVERVRPWRLMPRGAQRVAVGALAVPALGFIGMITAALASGDSPVFWMLFPVTLAGAMLGPTIAERHLRRLMRRHPPTTSLAGAQRGQTVRVRGRVRPGATFESAGTRRPCVLACYAGTVDYVTGRLLDGIERPWWEVSGIDFALELPGGGVVEVRVRDAHLVQQPDELRVLFWGQNRGGLPTPLRRRGRYVRQGTVTETILGETSVAPGDEIEVLGILDHEVSPQAEGTERGGHLQPVLRAGPFTPLVVRRCDEDAPVP